MRRCLASVFLLLAGCVYDAGPYYYTTTEETPPSRNAVTQDDLRKLCKAGVSDEVVIARLRTEGVQAKPTAEDVAQMKQEGVSDKVIEAWVSSPVAAPVQRRVVYRYSYPYYGYPYYPYYYGGWWGYPHWGVGFSYGYHHCH